MPGARLRLNGRGGAQLGPRVREATPGIESLKNIPIRIRQAEREGRSSGEGAAQGRLFLAAGYASQMHLAAA
eukprot:3125941-Heterocapsa_arctica.AAC.1